MAILFKSDGTVKTVFPNNGRKFEIDEIQTLVGGYIEVVWLTDGNVLVLDEEGKCKEKPINTKATEIAHSMSGILPSDIIVGDVIMCGRNEV